MSSSIEKSRHKEAGPPRIKFDFLDGLRAFAAMSIVFYHSFNSVSKDPGKDATLSTVLFLHAFNWLNYGALAVPVFIVISGYCLMLPVTRSLDGRLAGGVSGFLKRRCRRILPPYYVALAISIMLTGLFQIAHSHVAALRALNMPSLTLGRVLSHIFLVENVSSAWRFTIDGPMWSVAAESQIYILFALVLLPIWRRFGNAGTLIAAFIIGLTPYLYFHPYCSEYIGLFGLGMVGAVITVSQQASHVRLRERTPWGVVTSILLILFILWGIFRPSWFLAGWEINTLAGLCAISAILYCAQKILAASPKKPLPLRVLESRLATGIGAFSYSIYLVHHPIIVASAQVLQHLHLSPPLAFTALIGFVVPMILLLAYLFYLAFEKPFIKSVSTGTTNPFQLPRLKPRSQSVAIEEHAAP